MPNAPEKRISTLPSIRVSETLEIALLKLASRADRRLTEYVRQVLEKHAFGHALSFGDDEGDSQ